MRRVRALLAVLFAAGLAGCGSPENVEVGLEAPIQVSKGDEFVIVATVKNTAGEKQTLVSLDVGDEYLSGIAIVKTEPDHREATHIPVDNTMSYVFKLPVGPGEEARILLHAKAIKTGDCNGEIDFCINSDVKFLTRSIRTIVE